MTKIASICLADVDPASIRWLWSHRIPQGMLTIVEGEPAEGKSLMLADLMARVTNREAMPFDVVVPHARQRRGVLLLNQEDHIAAVLRRRLEAAGANLRHVHVKTKTSGGKALLVHEHLNEIESEAKRVKARLIVIDPIQDFLAFAMSNNQKIRAAMQALDEMAQRLDAAVIVVRHLAKNSGRDSRHRGLGGMSMIGRARFAFRVEVPRGQQPSDPDRILTCIKSNAGMRPLDVHFRLPAEHTMTPRVEWVEEVQPPPIAVPAAPPTELERAQDFLIEFLSGGPRLALEVFATGDGDHLSERTLRRAQAQLGVESVRHGNAWHWLFPDHRDRLGNFGNLGNQATQSAGQHGQDGQDDQEGDADPRGFPANVIPVEPQGGEFGSRIGGLEI